jgi:glycerophosphodiester phosphodiesterase
VKEGIDAVIVDSVLAIRKGLTTHPGKEEVKEETAKDMEKLAIDEREELQRRVGAASG